MRNELETIEKIEQYLSGGQSAEERAAFERQMAEDPGLREQVRLQQEILSGIRRAAWREKISRAGTRYHFRKRLFRGGSWGAGALIVCAALTWWLLPVMMHREPSGETSTRARQTSTDGVTFLIDGSRDTVVETNAGIVFSIPAGSFVRANGSPVTGPMQVTVREALDAGTIIRSGLSTMSGDQLLETGGMFSIDASKDGESLKIDSAKGVYAEIPTDSVKPGMEVYTGRPAANGGIDWVNPRPLEHDLVAVDILSLDFYPPHYLDSLRHWGYDSRNKPFTDSLYYSLAALFGEKKDSSFGEVQISAPSAGHDSVYTDTSIGPVLPMSLPSDCGINPAKIKAIWSRHFQHTLLATREFGERMPWIHRTERNDILDLYVDNPDRPLWEIDSMAARMFKGTKNIPGTILEKENMLENEGFRNVFLSFYHRHDGRVKTNSAAFARLGEYYRQKVKAYTAAIARTEKEFWDKQASLDQAAATRQAVHEADSVARVSSNFEEEFHHNLATVCRQLGYDTLSFKTPPSGAVYVVSLKNTGWYNIDRAVFQSTLDRTSMQWTDAQTGKTAHIDYRPVSIEVAQRETYDRVYVYLLPDQLSSYMRMQEINSKFTEKLNSSIRYGLVCLAYKKDQAFYFSQPNIDSGDHAPITLAAIGKEELDHALSTIGRPKQQADLLKETAFIREDIGDQARQQRNHESERLRLRLMAMLFWCLVGEGGGVISPK